MAPILFALILSIILPIIIILLLKQTSKSSNSNLPPGPRRLPIIGNLHQIGSLPHHALHKLSTRHGPLMFMQLGSIPSVVISSNDVVREIVKEHDIIFSGRPSLFASKMLSYKLKTISFAPYGEYWRQARRVCMVELFSHKRVQSFRAVREREVSWLVESIRRLAVDAKPVNLSKMNHLLANNIVRCVAFGEKYGAGYSDSAGSDKFLRLLLENQKLLGGFSIADFFPRLEWIHNFDGLKAKLDRVFGELDEFYDVVIEEHIKDGCKVDEDEDLVDVLLRLQNDPAGGGIFSTRDHIKGILQDVFIAGTDTASATTTWMMTQLIKNPRVMLKAQQELRNVVGDKGRVEEPDLQRLDYLKLVINEVLRLHPPAPLLVPRETIEPCTIREYDIPSKTRVFINAKAIAMDENVWKNPGEFWPERFLEGDDKNKGQAYSFIPFGIGRRMCPGENFGRAIVEIAVANLLFCFDWSLLPGFTEKDVDLEEEVGITMQKKRPLVLLAKPHYI